jgi:hypothetical protein
MVSTLQAFFPFTPITQEPRDLLAESRSPNTTNLLTIRS